MTTKPKKAAPKKAAAAPPAPKAAAPESDQPSAVPPPVQPVRGAERARLSRLAAAGYTVDRCALLDIPLDIGPRANRWHAPKLLGDDIVSRIAIAIAESKAPPEALELAAARLADRGRP